MSFIIDGIEFSNWTEVHGFDFLPYYSRRAGKYHIMIYNIKPEVYSYSCYMPNTFLLSNIEPSYFKSAQEGMDYIDLYFPKLDKLKVFL